MSCTISARLYLLLLLMFELDLLATSWFRAQSMTYVRTNKHGRDLEVGFRKIMLKEQITLLYLCQQNAPIAAQPPTSRPWFYCMSILRGGADRSSKQRLPQKRKRAAKAEENPLDQTIRDLGERKERWKELCDPSDVDDLSSERGDSDQPDIYKPPLEIEEGDVRNQYSTFIFRAIPMPPTPTPSPLRP